MSHDGEDTVERAGTRRGEFEIASLCLDQLRRWLVGVLEGVAARIPLDVDGLTATVVATIRSLLAEVDPAGRIAVEVGTDGPLVAFRVQGVGAAGLAGMHLLLYRGA